MPDVDFSALSRFSRADLSGADTIAALSRDCSDQLEEAGTYKGALGALRRSDDEKANNNAVRTELLKSLGQAFHIEGMVERGDGKVTFNKAFMDRLGKLFGADLKQEDFGISADGSVASGRPLTKRRITAILHKAASYVDASQEFSPYVYADRAKTFVEELKKIGGTKSEAVKNLANTVKTAADMLNVLSRRSVLGGLIMRNGMDFGSYAKIAKDSPYIRKWIVYTLSESHEAFEGNFVNGEEDSREAYRKSGLDIDLNITSLDSLPDGKKDIKAYEQEFMQKLQVFVKTACDAWGKVQQGQIPADRFLEAFKADAGQGPSLDAFLANMQALEAAG